MDNAVLSSIVEPLLMSFPLALHNIFYISVPNDYCKHFILLDPRGYIRGGQIELFEYNLTLWQLYISARWACLTCGARGIEQGCCLARVFVPRAAAQSQVSRAVEWQRIGRLQAVVSHSAFSSSSITGALLISSAQQSSGVQLTQVAARARVQWTYATGCQHTWILD